MVLEKGDVRREVGCGICYLMDFSWGNECGNCTNKLIIFSEKIMSFCILCKICTERKYSRNAMLIKYLFAGCTFYFRN
jgi:hypothetical protein